jgi:hypothetical protein
MFHWAGRRKLEGEDEILYKRPILMTFLFAVLAAAVPALADSYKLVLSPGNCGTGASCDSFTFTTTVKPKGGNIYDVSFDVANTGKLDPNTHQLVYDPAYLQGFSLTLFSASVFGTTVTADPALDGVSVQLYDNSKYNNGNDSCGSGTHPGSVCLDVTSAAGIYLPKNAHQEFAFTLTLAPGGQLLTGSWHVMTNGTKYANGKGGNIFALSNDGAPVDVPTPSTPTPEPGALTILSTGILAVGGALLRRKR